MNLFPVIKTLTTILTARLPYDTWEHWYKLATKTRNTQTTMDNKHEKRNVTFYCLSSWHPINLLNHLLLSYQIGIGWWEAFDIHKVWVNVHLYAFFEHTHEMQPQELTAFHGHSVSSSAWRKNWKYCCFNTNNVKHIVHLHFGKYFSMLPKNNSLAEIKKKKGNHTKWDASASLAYHTTIASHHHS